LPGPAQARAGAVGSLIRRGPSADPPRALQAADG